jgi:hypothetical protein
VKNKIYPEQRGKVLNRHLRVSDAEAADCERRLGWYLDHIIRWRDDASLSDREALVREISEQLSKQRYGQTFIERVVVNWRLAREAHARVIQLRRSLRARGLLKGRGEELKESGTGV